MINYTREQLNERYKSLPKDVQEAIIGIETADIIGQIGNEKKMMIDKVGELADETGLVLLGFTRPSQFVSHLSERLRMEKSAAKEIAEEINTRIFFPIRENLKKIHGLREEEAEKEEIEAPTLAESDVGVPTPPKADVGKEFKKQESPEITEEKTPVAPAPSLLPSALMPESAVLETTILVQPVPVEPETETPHPPATPQAPVIPKTPETPAQPATSIFEAKTKEGVFRAPAEASEKPALTQTTEDKKIDPYREPTK